ncbi:MAG: phage tail protein [Prevotellaceae bacterium]|jgi:phage tail-like protein|nr:phage tail protein [Prevotellaceae bacterium]
MADNWNLPVAFYFSVEIQGEPKIGELTFKEVSGLTIEVETETIREGGLNNYEHKLPKGVKHPNLALKSAVRKTDTINEVLLQKWQKTVFNSDFALPIPLRSIIVKLLNANGKPLRTWTCTNAYPVKIETDSFDAEKNQIAIETLEFCYQELM